MFKNTNGLFASAVKEILLEQIKAIKLQIYQSQIFRHACLHYAEV